MKINGSLVFDGSSASEIQNLRLQKVTALPGIVAGDVGRLVYNTNTNSIHVGANVGNVLSWIPLATGGDASALLSEVDRIETALGLNTDGSFDAAAFTGTLAGQTNYAGLITTLQGLAAAASTAAADEATAARAAEAALGTRITTELATAATNTTTAITTAVAAEATRATGVEGVLRTDLDAEVTRATGAESALGGRITSELATAVTNTNTAITTGIAAEQLARETADTALSDRIDDEVDARGTAITTVTTSLATEVTRATDAETALGGRITTEVSDRTAAVNTVAGNLATEVSDRTAAVTTLSTALGNEVTRATAQEAAIRGEMASALVGLSWEAPVDLVATTASSVDLTGLPNGYRIADTTGIFTVNAGVLSAPEALVDGAAFFNRTNDIGYTFNGTAIVPFSGASSFSAGAGLAMVGNTVNVGNTDGSITITADEISVSAAVRTEITDNAAAVAAEADRATTAEEGLDSRVDDEIADRIAAVEAVTTAIETEVTDRTNAIGAEQLARSNAITSEAGQRAAADTALAGRIDGVVTSVTDETAARGAAIAAEVIARDAAIAVEAAARLAADNAEVTARDAAIAAEALARTTAATAEAARVDAAAAAVGARISSMYFLYVGDGPATTHTVTHNLGQQYCNVTVVDSSNNVVIPESVVFTSATALTVTFNTAIACRVVVMGLAPTV